MMASDHMISVRQSELIVDSLNEATELDGGEEARIKFLLKRLQTLLNRTGRCALAFIDELDRSLRLLKRCVIRPPWDNLPLEEEPIQQALDQALPIKSIILPRTLSKLRTPVTLICSQDVVDREWFRSVFVPKYLKPMGYADLLISVWADSPDRALYMTNLRRESDPEFGDADRTLMSLMLRAIAPMVDREMFKSKDAPASLTDAQLSKRQHEILLLLLCGDSEKEIANTLHRSVHTVHTFVRQLYEHFDVSSRGELMALFIDKAVFQLDHAAN